MTNNSRYMTKAISEELDIELQVVLWQFYDEINEQRKEQMDYLQVFEISVCEETLTITNRQEVPSLQTKVIINNKVKGAKNTTVWIIDDERYQTMLFPKDY
ncbi:hypothetical protein B5V88_05375 [Heyndrickxia sporothermodurans]|uniref:DUF960 domain-containing protein n=1 Tax=Heyndrickxia sporothermodurans TaxID=46224 RepID=A0AB37HDE0_9BACI|nr:MULTISPECIES: DUF960 family protein [Bacillaceae]MBL5766579.1 hypothetical protein [Heyndrickxia sporothermodurans]MBL5770018.1 hypothetical protein [Heyndrickxia sporothermodurans]MBL5773695.1 hypothetical protein [Heyndrickxia sporothermodurans]MBL5777319.1 hypothetical protein [Heyndrickxia sporothermodurans]MBL5780751.1 hypothetical protein [Heyndrickxia sporothermodurans]